MGYDIRKRVKVITENTTITDTDFGGWMCVNTGSGLVEVDKVPLQPTQGLDFTAAIRPEDHYKSPINIVVHPNGELVLSQLICKPNKNDESLLSLLKEFLRRK